jgi:hypothetical protein
MGRVGIPRSIAIYLQGCREDPTTQYHRIIPSRYPMPDTCLKQAASAVFQQPQDAAYRARGPRWAAALFETPDAGYCPSTCFRSRTIPRAFPDRERCEAD